MIKLNYILANLSKRKNNGKIWNVRFSLNSMGKVITYVGTNSIGELIEYSMHFDNDDNYKFISATPIKNAETAKKNKLFDKIKKICYNIIIR